MKKISGWMIFWIIILFSNIYHINHYSNLANLILMNKPMLPDECLESVRFMKDHTMYTIYSQVPMIGVVFISIILFLLYKNAPN